MANEMTCKECRRMLLNYLDGTLSPTDRVAMTAHLAECPDCAAALAEWQDLGDAVRSQHTLLVPAPAASSRMWEQIAARTKGVSPMNSDIVADRAAVADSALLAAAPPHPHRLARRRRGIFPVALAVLAALLVVVTAIGVRLRQAAVAPASPLVVVSVGSTSQQNGQGFNISGVDPRTGHVLWHSAEFISTAMLPSQADIVSATRQWVHESNGTIYVYASDPAIGTPALIALRVRDGHMLWHVNLPETPSIATLLADATGAYLLFTHQKATEIVAYAAADGRARWQAMEPFGIIGYASVGAQTLAVKLFPSVYQLGQAINDGELFALDTAHGTVRWHAPTQSGILSIIGPTLYMGSSALSLEDGHIIWQQERNQVTDLIAPIGDALLYANYSSCTFCPINYIPSVTVSVLRATTGAVLWQQSWKATPTMPYRVPAVTLDAHYIYISVNGVVEARIPDTGAIVWQANVSAEYSFPDGQGLLFARTAKQMPNAPVFITITALHTADGSIAWRYQLPGAEDIVAVADGLVVIGRNQVYFSDPSTLTALRGSSGAVAWQAQISGSILFVIPT